MFEGMRELANFFVLQVVAMFVITLLIPRLKITSLFGAIGIVGALAVVNSTLWDSSLFHAIPDFSNSKSLALIGVNGVVFFILVKVLPGIEMKGILAAFLAPIAYTFATILIQSYAPTFDVFDAVDKVRTWFGDTKSWIEDEKGKEGVKPSFKDQSNSLLQQSREEKDQARSY